MARLGQSNEFNFQSLFLEKKSIEDYTKAEIERCEILISKAYAEKQKLSPELLHYLILRDGNPN
jgi:hypothetical protein